MAAWLGVGAFQKEVTSLLLESKKVRTVSTCSIVM